MKTWYAVQSEIDGVWFDDHDGFLNRDEAIACAQRKIESRPHIHYRVVERSESTVWDSKEKK